MNHTHEKLAAETALKTVFDFDSDDFNGEVKDFCPLYLFNLLMDEKSLTLTLSSGEVVELQPYFELMDNDDSRDVFGLLQSIQYQTVSALGDADTAKSNTIEIYDTYVIVQDESFWKLTPTQFVALCKEGVETGGHTLPDTIKMLKTPPKGVKRFGYDYFAADKTIKVYSPLKWREDDYRDSLKSLGIYL